MDGYAHIYVPTHVCLNEWIVSDDWIVIKTPKWKLKNVLADVIWCDSFNKRIIDFIHDHQGFVLSIGQALELGLHDDERAVWGSNLGTHNHELDRNFLRLTIDRS